MVPTNGSDRFQMQGLIKTGVILCIISPHMTVWAMWQLSPRSAPSPPHIPQIRLTEDRAFECLLVIQCSGILRENPVVSATAACSKTRLPSVGHHAQGTTQHISLTTSAKVGFVHKVISSLWSCMIWFNPSISDVSYLLGRCEPRLAGSSISCRLCYYTFWALCRSCHRTPLHT